MRKKVVSIVMLVILIVIFILVFGFYSGDKSVILFQPAGVVFGESTPGNGVEIGNSFIVDLNTSSIAGEHYSFVDFNSDLVLWLRFDDMNSNGDPLDLSSYGNDGTLNGNIVINDTNGYFGKGAWFDGASDNFINISHSDSQNIVEGITIAMWVKRNDPNTADDLFAKRNNLATDFSYQFVIHESNNGLRFGARDVSGTFNMQSSGVINDTDWHHIAFSWDTFTDNYAFYIDGADAGNGTSTNRLMPYNQPITIGNRQGGLNYFGGLLDEVMLFNRSLNNLEISVLYNSTNTQYRRVLVGLSEGAYDFKGYAVDKNGAKFETDLRSINVNVNPVNLTLCGNGLMDLEEECDDGNTVLGDGCSSLCEIESGFTCVSEPSNCTFTQVCGDGITEGEEECDDANLISGDGCSSSCGIEQSSGSGRNDNSNVVSICGNGILEIGENCDDGNIKSGDGCSTFCFREIGFSCNINIQPSICYISGIGIDDKEKKPNIVVNNPVVDTISEAIEETRYGRIIYIALTILMLAAIIVIGWRLKLKFWKKVKFY